MKEYLVYNWVIIVEVSKNAEGGNLEQLEILNIPPLHIIIDAEDL